MPSTTDSRPTFASDNWAPAHPRVMEELQRANSGMVPAYGDDPFTAHAIALLKRHLGEHAIPFLVLTGTGANVLSLGSGLRPWEGVICPETAHIYASETGAPEWHLGTRLLTVPSSDGKLTVEGMRSRIEGIGVQSRVQPKMVSISQATEYGTVYTPDELRALTSAAHEAGLYVHMDGARIANAAASLGVSLAEASSACGIDVLSFGATKNGALCAEAVVFFDEKLAEGFGYRRKQGMQLASKMRFVAAQIVGLLDDDTWLENARQANAMAKRLGDGLAAMSGVTLTQPVDSNQVFVRIAPERLAALQQAGVFHTWDAARSEYRFVCAYDQTAEDVDRFLAAARGR
jgi:threonine aldolase